MVSGQRGGGEVKGGARSDQEGKSIGRYAFRLKAVAEEACKHRAFTGWRCRGTLWYSLDDEAAVTDRLSFQSSTSCPPPRTLLRWHAIQQRALSAVRLQALPCLQVAAVCEFALRPRFVLAMWTSRRTGLPLSCSYPQPQAVRISASTSPGTDCIYNSALCRYGCTYYSREVDWARGVGCRVDGLLARGACVYNG